MAEHDTEFWRQYASALCPSPLAPICAHLGKLWLEIDSWFGIIGGSADPTWNAYRLSLLFR